MNKTMLEAKLICLNQERSALARKLADQYSPLLRTAGELCARPHQLSPADVQLLHDLPTSTQIKAEFQQFQARTAPAARRFRYRVWQICAGTRTLSTG